MNGQALIKERLIVLDDMDMLAECLPQEVFKNAKRQLRKPLLNALDIYDKNVSKGRILETEDEKATVDGWYRNICDLKDEAFINVPSSIKKYSGA